MTGYQTIVAQEPRAEPSGQRVGVVYWHPADGMAGAIAEALAALGHTPLPFAWDAPIPAEAQIIFSQGPYGRFLSVPRQLSRLAPDKRPALIHWNDEGWPDLRLPWPVTAGLAAGRSWVGRMDESSSPAVRRLGGYPPANWLRSRMKRFSYLGDYRHAFRQGWLTLLVDFSQIYAGLHSAHGLPTLAVPWGAVPSWSADLGLERDIDVLWMGARASRRRSRLLDRVREELQRLGVEMYVADNEEHPFIFGEERTQMLNRAKITLNLTRTWYDDNFLRFPIVMPNGSLVVSEPLLPHCPDYVPSTHYAAAPIPKLAETIYHYLAHADERQAMVDNARQLMRTRLTLENCVRRIMAAVVERQAAQAQRGA